MTRAARFSTVTIILIVLAFGILLVVTGGIALLMMRNPPHAANEPLFAPNSEIHITAVPTVEQQIQRVGSGITTLASQPALETTPNILPVSDRSSGMPTSVPAAAPPTIPGPLVDPELGLLTGPVDVPLELRIPTLHIKAPVLGVGLTLTSAMASPIGILPNDPIWQSVFWYRGGGIPGDVGTATISGHFDDAEGRPAVFAYLSELGIGDLIIVHDKRSGLDIAFVVSETKTYTEDEASDPAVLSRVFGTSSSMAAESYPVSDQLARLTLITCAGAWVDGSFDGRLVVYAVRATYPLGLGM